MRTTVNPCGCKKLSLKLRDIKLEAKRLSKLCGHTLYFYRCPKSRFYHMTKKKRLL